MAGGNRLSARFGADTSDFKDGIKAINREMKLVDSEFRATASTMEDWSNNATGLEARMNALNKSIELQKEKTEALKIRYEQLAKEHGENSIQAQNAGIEFNKEAEKLGKLQTELRKTETGLKSLKGETTKVKGAFHDMGTQFDKLKQQVPALGTAMSLLTNPITLAIGLLGAFASASNKSIQKTVEYNKQVREMMQITGLSAEEISRIIQVSDDWGISIGEARSALEMMNKKGISPTIENLAKIADEYINSKDKAAFAEEANKKYGKSFSTIIPILAEGGDALREQTKAVDKNLLATDDSIETARQWEVALDDLGDEVMVLAYKLGNKLLPPLVKFATTTGKNIDATKNYNDTLKAYNSMVKAGLIVGEDQISIGERWADTFATLEEKTEKYTYALSKVYDAATMLYPEEERFVQLYADMVKGTEELIEVSDDLILVLEAQQRHMANLKDYINGQLGPAEEDFKDAQGDIAENMAITQDEIDKLISEGYDPMGEKIIELKGKYEELKGQYKENAEEHEEATKLIILDMLAQQMALQGMTDPTAFAIIAQNWGLIDQATVNTTINIGKAINWLRDHPGDRAGFIAIMNGVYLEIVKPAEAAKSLAEQIDRMTGEHDIILNFHVIGDKIPSLPPSQKKGAIPGFQHGVDMMVPSGYDNDTFPFLASSGERVIVIPPNERFGGALSAIQQMMAGMIFGMGGMAGGGGGNMPYAHKAAAPMIINQYIQTTPDDELDKRRLARYIAEEFQRRNL